MPSTRSCIGLLTPLPLDECFKVNCCLGPTPCPSPAEPRLFFSVGPHQGNYLRVVGFTFLGRMEQYVPLVEQDTTASYADRHDSPSPSDVDFERPDGIPLPRWYRLPGWTGSSRWEMGSGWKNWSRHDIPDAKTSLWGILSFILALMPRYMRPGGLRVNKQLHPTAYLDALRGWVALLVMNFHTFGNKATILEKPVFSAFLNGRAMVDIFFVISGYVLSHRLLRMMHNHEPGFQKAIASSTFRRWLRLYASTAIASLVTAIAVYLGWCRPEFRKGTFLAQMDHWMWDTIAASNPFADIHGYWSRDVFRTQYLDQMWTIPVEFRGSLVVFWFCAAASCLSTRGRRIFCCVVMALCYLWAAAWASIFLLGVLIADFSFDRYPERLSRIRLPQQQNLDTSPEKAVQRQSPLAKVGYVFLLLIAMFILGQPPTEYGYEGYFLWPYLSKAIPWYYPAELGQHIWLSVGSSLLVFVLDRCRMLQIPLESGFSQYLGDLSFGVYAMHNTVNWCLYMPYVEPWRAVHLGDSFFSGLPGMVFTTLVILWVADYFTRIDNYVVWLGKWMESKTFV